MKALLAVVSICVLLAGCSSSGRLEGTYRANGSGNMVLDFKGGKVTVSLAGESKTLDYSVDGDRITLIDPEEGDMVLTRNSDGSINSAFGTFVKR